MTDLHVDAVLHRLDTTAIADPTFEARTLDDLLARVHQARREDARPFAGVVARLRWALPVAQAPRVAWLLVVGLLLALALWVTVLVGSRPRLPEPFGPAANGLIVLDDGTHIVAMEPDGSGRHALTAGPGVDTQPAVSLDGTRIAFLRDEGGGPSLVVAAIDGSEERVALAADALGDLSLIPDQPAWSPDGRHLAVTVLEPGATVGGEHAEIVVVAADGSGYERVLSDTLFSAEQAAWSPDEIHWRSLANPAAGPARHSCTHPPSMGPSIRRLSARVGSATTEYCNGRAGHRTGP